MSFKSLVSKISVRSVAVLNSLMQEVKYGDLPRLK